MILARIKSLDQIKKIQSVTRTGGECYQLGPRFINKTMSRKCGDGKIYFFKEIDDSSPYTHRCLQDEFLYHEDWLEFVEGGKIKKFLFNPEELVT